MFCTPDFRKKFERGETSNITGNGMSDCIRELSDIEDRDKMSGFVFIAPSQDNKESKDIDSFGALSYAISKAFATLKLKGTYRDLFEIIYTTIYNKKEGKQIPQAEGNLDNLVFSSSVSYSKPYYSINGIASNGYYINGGEFNGLYQNSIVGLYPEGTDDPMDATPTYKGKLIHVEGFKSVIGFGDIQI